MPISMPGTFSNLQYHLVFSTKHRQPLIYDEWQSRLYEYFGGILRGESGVLFEIGGMPDHIHLLFGWRTNKDLASLVRNLKSNSSKWIHSTFPQSRKFQWQSGYGIFSISESEIEKVSMYIRNQRQHHARKSFKDEFLELLRVHQIEYDEKYIWD